MAKQYKSIEEYCFSIGHREGNSVRDFQYSRMLLEGRGGRKQSRGDEVEARVKQSPSHEGGLGYGSSTGMEC